MSQIDNSHSIMTSANVSVRQLRAFQLLAEYKSFTQAAAKLGVTQSGLSLLIKELESELELRLVDRHPRLVELTSAGVEFLGHAKRTLNSLNDAVGAMRELRDLQRGRVRVGAPQMLAFAHLPFITAQFVKSFPNVDVSLVDGIVSLQLDQLRDGDLDLVIGPDATNRESVDAFLLTRSEVGLVCGRQHALASRKVVKWKELRNERFISATPDVLASVQNLLHREAEEQGLRFDSIQTVDYMTTAIGMASAGLGITMCPNFVKPFLKAAGLVMLRLADPPFFRDVYIYSAANRSPTPAMQAFNECAVKYFK